MIILDLQQIMLSNLMMGMQKHEVTTVGDHLLRHMILNSIRYNLVKFRNLYGNLVIASDGGKYWRKEIFPNYKWHRNEAREKDAINWELVFESMNRIRDEIRDNFNYPLINIEGVEADDIIAVLAIDQVTNHNQGVLILSSDKDFVQLQSTPGITQFDPVRKKAVEHENPKRYLYEHIIKGDRGDGIPNIKSNDNCFVEGNRQNRIQTKDLDKWVDMLLWGEEPDAVFNGEILRNWHRNRNLVDLSYVPPTIKQSIFEEFERQTNKLPKDLTRYFMKHNLRNLLGAISEF